MAFQMGQVRPEGVYGGSGSVWETPVMSDEAISKQVASLNVDQIGLISNKIVETVVNRLTQFLSYRQIGQMKAKAVMPVIEIMKRAFQTPLNFTENGYSFVLSDGEPQGFIKTAATECVIALDTTHIPRSYVVSLEVFKAATSEWGGLVFLLREFSCGKEETKKTFSMTELEKQYSEYARNTDSS